MSEVPLNSHAPGWLEQAEKGVGSVGKDVDACSLDNGVGSFRNRLGFQHYGVDGWRTEEAVDGKHRQGSPVLRERERARGGVSHEGVFLAEVGPRAVTN